MKYCFNLTHLFPWSRTAGTNPPLTPCCMKEIFPFSAGLGWQTDLIDWQIQTDRGRADLRTAPTGCLTVDINLYLASGSVKLGHFLMCVMLHNQLCQPKGWGTAVSVVCETRKCKHTAGLMGNASVRVSFQSETLPVGGRFNRNLSWSFAVRPNQEVYSSNSPGKTRHGGNVYNAEIHEEWQNEQIRYANVLLRATCVQWPKLLALET